MQEDSMQKHRLRETFAISCFTELLILYLLLGSGMLLVQMVTSTVPPPPDVHVTFFVPNSAVVHFESFSTDEFQGADPSDNRSEIGMGAWRILLKQHAYRDQPMVYLAFDDRIPRNVVATYVLKTENRTLFARNIIASVPFSRHESITTLNDASKGFWDTAMSLESAYTLLLKPVRAEADSGLISIFCLALFFFCLVLRGLLKRYHALRASSPGRHSISTP